VSSASGIFAGQVADDVTLGVFDGQEGDAVHVARLERDAERATAAQPVRTTVARLGVLGQNPRLGGSACLRRRPCAAPTFARWGQSWTQLAATARCLVLAVLSNACGLLVTTTPGTHAGRLRGVASWMPKTLRWSGVDAGGNGGVNTTGAVGAGAAAAGAAGAAAATGAAGAAGRGARAGRGAAGAGAGSRRLPRSPPIKSMTLMVRVWAVAGG
jgi:hypothetical protein